MKKQQVTTTKPAEVTAPVKKPRLDGFEGAEPELSSEPGWEKS